MIMRLDLFLDVEWSSVVGLWVGNDLEAEQRVLDLRRLMTKSDVGRRFTESWTRLHTYVRAHNTASRLLH